jgi:hypothetical protein
VIELPLKWVSFKTNYKNLYDLACPAGVEPATYGLEGLANLRNTMFNNDLQCPDLGVHQNRGGHGVGWAPMLGARCLQAFVGKTDIYNSFT